MTIRKVLIFAPLAVILILLQSYFWVPTYEQQTRGNPNRLNEYITASIGDASLLNPILSADSASSDVSGMVFEGLIDRDEELRFRGRLATSWEIHEEAFFHVNPPASLTGRETAPPETVLELLQSALAGDIAVDQEVRDSLDNIREISLVPPGESRIRTEKEGETEKAVQYRISPPARIKLTLDRVDQKLFENLARVLGEDYFVSFPAEKFVTIMEGDDEKPADRSTALQFLPAVEHNPILLFHLRHGVRFHDGHLLDARDVKFTYEAIMNPKNLSPRIADYEPVKHVEVIDPHTVRVVYKRLYSPAFGTWSMGILPEHRLNSRALREEAVRLGRDPENYTMRQSTFNRNPVGCGPFVFREWKSDQYIRLDRFDDYWEGAPNYRHYVYRIVPDLLTQEMEFYAGTVDTYGVQPHQVKRLQDDPRYQSFSGLSFGYTYIGYNMRREPFNDRRVRKALGMAIDVEKIMKYVLHGQGERITGPFPKQTDYYNHDVRPISYDPEGAVALLEQAGWRPNEQGWLERDGRRFQFTLITNSGNDLRKAVMAIVQDAWRHIGIDVRTDLLEWSVFIQERVDKADFDALVLGWQMGIDPDLFQIWHSSQTNPYQLNFVAFKNPLADDLIVRIRQEYDYREQVRYCHRLHSLIAEEQPYTFLYVGKWTAIMDKRIVIKEMDAEGRVIYKKITPTKTGIFTFHFNKWIKLPVEPTFAAEG